MADLQTDTTTLKRAAAARALDFVSEGMRLGLGSGSTSEQFLDLLGARVRGGLKLTCAPTSERIAQIARSLGIVLANLDDLAPLDLAVDGADEADRAVQSHQGRRHGALLREKIVAASSRADDRDRRRQSKLVARLGAFPLPVEVVRVRPCHHARRASPMPPQRSAIRAWL